MVSGPRVRHEDVRSLMLPEGGCGLGECASCMHEPVQRIALWYFLFDGVMQPKTSFGYII